MAEQLVLLRNSERSKYRRCRQHWQWSYVDLHEPNRDKGALAFGRLAHQAWAAWYVPGRKRGEHPAEAFARLFAAEPIDGKQWDEEGNKMDPLELGITMMNGYVDKYGTEPHIEIIHPEMTYQIDVYDKLGNYLCTMVGTFDAVFRNRETKRTGLFEHKTGKRIVVPVRINSGYGEQGLTYWWAAVLWLRNEGFLKQDESIDQILFNWARKGFPDNRPRNAQGHALNKPTKDVLVAKCEELEVPSKGTVEVLMDRIRSCGEDPWLLGEPSKRQPAPLFARDQMTGLGDVQLARINSRIRSEAWEMAQVKAGKLPIYKNPTKDCDWDCAFKDVCELHEMGADWRSVLELEFHKWDPYEDHGTLDWEE